MAAPDAPASAALGGAALISAFGGVLGPVAGEWAVVALAALCGALAGVAEMETRTAATVWWRMVFGMALALLFTATTARLVAAPLGLPPAETLWPISGLIAWQQDRLFNLARSWWAQRRGPAP